MTALKQPAFISIEDYLAGEELAETKHEFLGGTVHAMAGGTNRHNTIALNAQFLLLGQLRGKSCQPFNGETKIRLGFPDHTRFYYPDAMVVCHPNPPTDHFQDLPVVVIEVLSESTRRTDLGEKRDAYLKLQSLQALLFVEPNAPQVTVWRRKAEGGFAPECHTGRNAVVLLPEIGAALPLAGLYERTEVPD
jgi:Uma2 family endonuclease